jgi:hypothetical protein
VILIAMYFPSNVQRRFAVGVMIPIVYFTTRAIEDYWFQRIGQRWRYRVFVFVIPLIVLSQLFVLFLPILPVLTGQLDRSEGLFLQRDYFIAFRWLENETSSEDVVLAAPHVSVWLPGWVGARVVYGHPYETLYAADKEAQVMAWYDGQTTDCASLLEDYTVRYVLVGPQENALGDSPCPADLGLEIAARFGNVIIYAV